MFEDVASASSAGTAVAEPRLAHRTVVARRVCMLYARSSWLFVPDPVEAAPLRVDLGQELVTSGRRRKQPLRGLGLAQTAGAGGEDAALTDPQRRPRGVGGDPRLAVVAEEHEPTQAGQRTGAAVPADADRRLGGLGLGAVGVLGGLVVGLSRRDGVTGRVGRLERLER